MAEPKNPPAGLCEAGRVESDAQALERETLAWSDGVRLSQPGAVPDYADLTGSLHASSGLCRRMATDPLNTTAETRYLEGVNTRIEKLISDIEDHEKNTDEQ